MKRLLIGYDGSACAEAMLGDLSLAALSEELEVVVMAVADVWLPVNPPGPDQTLPAPLPEAVIRARAQAMEAVRAAQAVADRAGESLRTLFPKWRIEACCCSDSPAWGILTKAAAWRADLITLGSHGRSTLERLFLGSVSQKVAAEATCSVRIARPRRSPHRTQLRQVLAIDGSPDSLAMVQAVSRRTWPALTEFRVVTVLDPRLETAIAWPDVYGAEAVHQQDHTARESVDRMLERSAEALRRAGLLVEPHLLTGDPKHELLRNAEAWEADALFLGARGRQHGGRLSLGTLASAVTARAHCSVEIVRTPAY